MADKQFLAFLIETPVTQVNPKYISEHIQSIHIESENFKPSTLIDKYHPSLGLKEFQNYHKVIPSQMARISDNLVVEYFF